VGAVNYDVAPVAALTDLSAQTQTAFNNVKTRMDGMANLGSYLGLFTSLPTNFSQLPAGASRNDFITLQTGTAPNVVQQRYVLTSTATSGAITAAQWQADVIYTTDLSGKANNTQASLSAGSGTDRTTGAQTNPTVWGMLQNIWNRLFAINNAIPASANLGEQGTAAFGQAVQNGSATTWSRSDHRHAIPAAPAQNIGTVAAANVTIGTTESTAKFGTAAINQTILTWLQQIGQRINGIITALGQRVSTTQSINGTAYGTGDITVTANPSGNASGDLGGSYPNPSVNQTTTQAQISTVSGLNVVPALGKNTIHSFGILGTTPFGQETAGMLITHRRAQQGDLISQIAYVNGRLNAQIMEIYARSALIISGTWTWGAWQKMTDAQPPINVPLADSGIGSIGSSLQYSSGNHQHPFGNFRTGSLSANETRVSGLLSSIWSDAPVGLSTRGSLLTTDPWGEQHLSSPNLLQLYISSDAMLAARAAVGQGATRRGWNIFATETCIFSGEISPSNGSTTEQWHLVVGLSRGQLYRFVVTEVTIRGQGNDQMFFGNFTAPQAGVELTVLPNRLRARDFSFQQGSTGCALQVFMNVMGAGVPSMPNRVYVQVWQLR
jgi:hypothetical protein